MLSFFDSLVVARRNLYAIVRVPTVLVFELVQPIMFVLLFVYVLRGPSSFRWVLDVHAVPDAGHLRPERDLRIDDHGDRHRRGPEDGHHRPFRLLPMARSAVLAGRTTSDLVKNFLVLLVVIGIGYLVGFSFEEGPARRARRGRARAGRQLHVLVDIGRDRPMVKEVEAVQAAAFTVIFPIVFVSSAFVPVAGMEWLQPIAEHNPVTHWCNLARYLSIGDIGTRSSGGTSNGVPIDTRGAAHQSLVDRRAARGLRAAVDPAVSQAHEAGREQRTTAGLRPWRRLGRPPREDREECVGLFGF